MRPWVKLWASRLNDSRLFVRGNDSAIAYFRFLAGCIDGEMPERSARSLMGPEMVDALLESGALSIRDVYVTDTSWKREQPSKVEFEGRLKSAQRAIRARWEQEKAKPIRDVYVRNRMEKEIEKEEENGEPEIAEAKPPRVCPAVEFLNETARASKGRFYPIERVTKRQALTFWPLRKAFPSKQDWALAGEWLAAGWHDYGNAITTATVLAQITDWIQAARGWSADGKKPKPSNGSNGHLVKSDPRQDEWERKLAQDRSDQAKRIAQEDAYRAQRAAEKALELKGGSLNGTAH